MSTENRKLLAIRLEALKRHHTVTWGELADVIGISRSMLDFLKAGTKDAGPRVLRRIDQAERDAGITPPIPTAGKEASEKLQRLEMLARERSPAYGTGQRERVRAAINEIRSWLTKLEKELED